MRASTSASQARGSTSFSLAVMMSEYIAAALSPPRSDPAKSHAFRPSATPRRLRSAALFERQMRPSSRKRVNVSQRRSMHSTHNGAKLPFDLALTLSRDQLRARYGDGFWGAPLQLCRPSEV